MRKWLLAVLPFVAGLVFSAPAYADTALKAAVNIDQRLEKNAARDAWRNPYETLMFFGIQPNMTVVELTPGGGWYTEILAPYLRDKGQYIAGVYNPESSRANYRRYAAVFQEKLASKPALFDRAKVTVFEPPEQLQYAKPGSADMVLTFRNLHNWMSYGEPVMRDIFRSAYTALKPGGVFGVVEHRLPEDREQDATASSGYMHESYVIKMAESVGFRLAEKSEVNANPKDTADHPGGVWALPPSLRNKEANRDKYLAIGESDRMTLKFVKP